MTSMFTFAWWVLIFLAVAPSFSVQAQSTAPAIMTQMARAQTENRSQFSPYAITRDYKLLDGSDAGLKAHVVAKITVLPPILKKYTIEEANGSKLGETIVRKMLDREVAFAKDSGASDITGDNYDFLLVREDQIEGQRCYVLALIPKRKSKDLLRGTIWVDTQTYLPRRVEGEPGKSPSWWLKDVRIVLRYGYVGRMWLQTSSEATANVRILGRSAVFWQDVGYQIGELNPVASLEPPLSSLDEAPGDGPR
jgi:hypothetical protein